MNQFPDLQLLSLHFLGQNIFSFQLVGNIDGYRLVENLNSKWYATKYRYRKGLDVCALGTVRNGNEQRKKQKPFPHKMSATVLTLVWLQDSN